VLAVNAAGYSAPSNVIVVRTPSFAALVAADPIQTTQTRSASADSVRQAVASALLVEGNWRRR
jgi:hypothetical protein